MATASLRCQLSVLIISVTVLSVANNAAEEERYVSDRYPSGKGQGTDLGAVCGGNVHLNESP